MGETSHRQLGWHREPIYESTLHTSLAIKIIRFSVNNQHRDAQFFHLLYSALLMSHRSLHSPPPPQIPQQSQLSSSAWIAVKLDEGHARGDPTAMFDRMRAPLRTSQQHLFSLPHYPRTKGESNALRNDQRKHCTHFTHIVSMWNSLLQEVTGEDSLAGSLKGEVVKRCKSIYSL